MLLDLKSHNYELDKVDQTMILAKTKILNPGESDTITFKPSSPGKYMYVCLMPAHGDMLGMKGYLTITKKDIKPNLKTNKVKQTTGDKK